MLEVYLPLLYAEKVKHPGQNHFLQRVLLWHWAFATIAYSTIAPHFLVSAIALLFLTLSYWCVYEIGYQENDLVGKKHECVPKLSEAFERTDRHIDLIKNPLPWLWAIALAIPGCVLVTLSQIQGPISIFSGSQLYTYRFAVLFSFTVWLFYLVAIRLSFWVYNQFDESSRVWIYPFLQTQRLFGYGLVTTTNTVGFVLLVSLSAARWMQYCIYRYGGNRWKFPVNIACLLLFVMLFTTMAITASEPMALVSWQAVAAISFCLLRSLRKISDVTATFQLIDKQK